MEQDLRPSGNSRELRITRSYGKDKYFDEEMRMYYTSNIVNR